MECQPRVQLSVPSLAPRPATHGPKVRVTCGQHPPLQAVSNNRLDVHHCRTFSLSFFLCSGPSSPTRSRIPSSFIWRAAFLLSCRAYNRYKTIRFKDFSRSRTTDARIGKKRRPTRAVNMDRLSGITIFFKWYRFHFFRCSLSFSQNCLQHFFVFFLYFALSSIPDTAGLIGRNKDAFV